MPEFDFGSLGGRDDKEPKKRGTSSQKKPNRKLKLELRALVEALAYGHKKYVELGFESMPRAKARIHEIIDFL